MIRTNRDRLVVMSVIGQVSSPVFRRVPYSVSAEGQPVVLPGVGGISYNVRVGDPATGWEADHVEPGVSIKNMEKHKDTDRGANVGLNVLSCIGNEAVVVSGEAKGDKGVVTGKHGGIEHVLVDFGPEALDKLVIGDKIMVRAFGVGLKLPNFSQVKVMNVDPDLLGKIPLKEEGDGLKIPVTHRIPAAIMGSGLGETHTYSGDYDIQLFDPPTVDKYGLDDLRLGDLVAVMDADHSYGRIYRQGAVSVGVVVHSDCVISGHGPGVTTIFTSSEGRITPFIDPEANLANFLGIRK